MSIAFDRSGVIFVLMTASAIVLPVCVGVAGCLCPNASKIILIYHTLLLVP